MDTNGCKARPHIRPPPPHFYFGDAVQSTLLAFVPRFLFFFFRVRVGLERARKAIDEGATVSPWSQRVTRSADEGIRNGDNAPFLDGFARLEIVQIKINQTFII